MEDGGGGRPSGELRAQSVVLNFVENVLVIARCDFVDNGNFPARSGRVSQSVVIFSNELRR